MSDRPDSAPQAAGPVRELTGRIGKYEIIRLLGKGAMGQVYLAHDTVLEREIALKVMIAQIADDPDLKTRFEREAKTVARMTHPNIVTVFDFGYHTDGSPYIAMELLRGQDLQRAVRTSPGLALEQKVLIVVQVLAGLSHAHQAGIVHRDIKPANIFLNADGTAKLMDFGVARLTTASMTGTGNIVGTADYMSPEQVRGAKVDGRSDLFSVGCVLFELLAGRRPFHSDNLMAIFYKITHEEPSWELLPGDATQTLVPILTKALDKDLDTRYSTAAEFASDLKSWLRTSAGGVQVQSALEALVDDGAPTVPPAVSEETVITGPSLAGTAGSATGPAPTARATKASTVLQPQPAARSASAPRSRPSVPSRPAPKTRSPLPIVLGVGGALLAGALGYVGLVLKPWQPAVTPTPTPAPSATVADSTPAPPVTPLPTPEATLAPPPPTTAPPPVVAEAPGSKAAASVKAARAAFDAGDYDRSLAAAQKALIEDPSNAAARQSVENAQAGQRAMGSLASAEQALRAGNFAQAQQQAEAAQKAAPWDARVTTFLGRVRDAQVQAQAQREKAAREAQAQQIAALLQRADAALGQQQYDQAVSLYDEVLKLDPSNARAGIGRTGALASRATAQAASARPAAGSSTTRVFVIGKTQAQSAETKAGAVPEGFEETPGVKVQRASVAGDLPGKLLIAVSPELVSAGERFTITVQLLNEGAAPIEVSSLDVTTTINGRRSAGPVPALVREVAPRQKADLWKTSGTWKEDTSSWVMEVAIRTTRGESYRNTVTWK